MDPSFDPSDLILTHLDGLVQDVDDPYLKSRYVGFVSVVAVTTFETNIRERMVYFASKKNSVFGSFTAAVFLKTNAKVRLDDIRKEYLGRFGEKYLLRFKRKIDALEKRSLRNGEGSIKNSYANLIQWRHDFVHDGRLPEYATYDEARKAYNIGKRVVVAFFESLRR